LSGGVTGRELKQQVEGPSMKEYDAPWYEDIRDFASGLKDHLAHGESWSELHNYWKSLWTPHEAVPVYDEDGNFEGTRKQTDQERIESIKKRKEAAADLYGLDPDSAEAWTAKAVSAFLDPSTYATPAGKTYKMAAVYGTAVGANDMVAYNLANEGKIDWKDVGIAGAFGAVLGPAAKLIVDKAIPAYKALRSKNPEMPHDEAMVETLKALPAPPERKTLPAPTETKLLESPQRSEAPRFIGTKGEVGSLQPHAPYKRTLVYKEADSLARKRHEEAEMWAARNTPEREGALELVQKALPNKDRNTITMAFEKAAKKEEEAIENVVNHMNQGGGVSPVLLHHMASTGIGATAGAIADGKEGAMVGAGIGLAAPTAIRHLVARPIKAIGQWSKHDAAGAFAKGKFLSSPTAALKRVGPAGRKLADMLDRFNENVDMRIGEKLYDFEKSFGHLNRKAMNRVRGLLDHTLHPKDATHAEKAAATKLRKELNSVLDDAVDAGIITRKSADKFKIKAREKGYFPRLYNTEYLGSKAGKEAWVEAWTKFAEKDEKKMLSALESIIGDKDIVSDVMKRTGGKMTRENALTLLRIMRNKSSHHGRSAHLEHARKLDENAEEILRPFLIDDPWAILAKYYDDVYRRIEGSKVFGEQVVGKKGVPVWNTDAKAEKLFSDILSSGDDDMYKLARDVFYTTMGDPKSTIVDKYIQLGDMEGRILRGAGGFETGAKLGLAQTANMFQATVNGMTRLLNVSGNPLRALQLYSHGLVRSLGKEGREFSQRIGASIETTLMEAAGEASHMGKFGEKTLKYTGFIAAEKYQRILGSNIGKAYAESLAARYRKIQAGTMKGWRAKRVLKQMKELGLPTDRPINSVDIDRAGLRFSNEINFRNTPDKLPMAWQTPYGKLFTKFKSFSFHQARFAKNNVIKPLLKGNPLPLVWYTAPAAGLGMGIDEVRRTVKGDDRELSMTERYLRGLTMIGGMGILQDTISSFYRGPEQGIANAAGPFIGDVARIGTGTIQAASGDPEKLLESVMRTFVFPGQEALMDQIGEEGKKRGSRSSRSSNRGGGRSGSGR
jgi:hypothetical protein